MLEASRERQRPEPEKRKPAQVRGPGRGDSTGRTGLPGQSCSLLSSSSQRLRPPRPGHTRSSSVGLALASAATHLRPQAVEQTGPAGARVAAGIGLTRVAGVAAGRRTGDLLADHLGDHLGHFDLLLHRSAHGHLAGRLVRDALHDVHRPGDVLNRRHATGASNGDGHGLGHALVAAYLLGDRDALVAAHLLGDRHALVGCKQSCTPARIPSLACTW